MYIHHVITSRRTIYSLFHLSIYSFIYSFSNTSIHSLTQPLILPFIHSFSHLPLIHSFILSLIHQFIHSFIHPFIQLIFIFPLKVFNTRVSGHLDTLVLLDKRCICSAISLDLPQVNHTFHSDSERRCRENVQVLF